MIELLLCIMGGCTVGMLVLLLLYHPEQLAIKEQLHNLNKSQTNDLYTNAMKKRASDNKGMFKNIKVSKKFENEILAADIPMNPGEFLVIWAMVTIVPTIICFVMVGNLIMACGIGITCFIIPMIIVNKKKNDRKVKFSEQLGDALVTITNGLRSGFSFQQTMYNVSKDMPDPISTEFTRALAEMDYGVSQEEALMNVYYRTENEDLKMLISSLAIATKTGGNLSEVLVTITNTIKERIRIKQDVKTMSAQGNMSALIIGGLPVAVCLMLMVMNPDYLEPLFQTTTGHIMIVVAVCMEILGFRMMKKITDVSL